MQDLAVEQVGDGGQADVRMGPHVDALAGPEVGRTHVIQEDERPHHPPRRVGQHALHLEPSAEVPAAALDDSFEHVRAFLDARTPSKHISPVLALGVAPDQ